MRTWAGVWLIVTVVALVVAEVTLRLVGLGHPVLYELSPEYGYRPRPDQHVERLHGAGVRINNLGLRAVRDWDTTTSNKVLFLGNSVTYGGSYVSDSSLFSERAVAAASGRVSGNGGVNGWGVDNIRGLIVTRGFLPARTYVSVLLEVDFHRGLAQRPPYFSTASPRFALTEALVHLRYQLPELLWPGPALESAPGARQKAEVAVRHLKEIDAFLRAKGRQHLIYISPYEAQLSGGQPRDFFS